MFFGIHMTGPLRKRTIRDKKFLVSLWGLGHDQELLDRRGQCQDRNGVTHHVGQHRRHMQKKYGLSPNTFYPWCKKFLDSGEAALSRSPSVRAARVIQKNAMLKTLVGEITLTNSVLKNIGEEKMMVVQRLIQQDMG